MTTSRVLVSSILNASAPVFLVSSDARDSQLTLHVAAGCDFSQLKTHIDQALSQADARVRVSVRRHSLRRLAFPRSLEHLLRRFSGDDVIYDPTMIVSRARALLSTAKACRAGFGSAIRGLYFDPESPGLLVLVRRGDAVSFADLQVRIRDMIAKAPDRETAVIEPDNGARWQGSVQVVSELPRRKVVPVDARSAGFTGKLAGVIRRWRTPSAIAIAISAAASLPAAAHTEIDYQGGGAVHFALASKSVPALKHYGLLPSLSMFAEAPRLESSDAFVSAVMKVYFGGMQVAQNNPIHRRGNPNEVGQVGS